MVFEYEEGSSTVREEWSENHAKLVYLLSRFGRAAMTADEKETWLRQVGHQALCEVVITNQHGIA